MGVSSSSSSSSLFKRCQALLRSLPDTFNLGAVAAAHPATYENSLNTTLQQELARYNGLLQRISQDLRTLVVALQGKAPMTLHIEGVAGAIARGRVPREWYVN